jgi:hypothetical protein
MKHTTFPGSFSPQLSRYADRDIPAPICTGAIYFKAWKKPVCSLANRPSSEKFFQRQKINSPASLCLSFMWKKNATLQINLANRGHDGFREREEKN